MFSENLSHVLHRSFPIFKRGYLCSPTRPMMRDRVPMTLVNAEFYIVFYMHPGMKKKLIIDLSCQGISYYPAESVLWGY